MCAELMLGGSCSVMPVAATVLLPKRCPRPPQQFCSVHLQRVGARYCCYSNPFGAGSPQKGVTKCYPLDLSGSPIPGGHRPADLPLATQVQGMVKRHPQRHQSVPNEFNVLRTVRRLHVGSNLTKHSLCATLRVQQSSS
jgi:hypothetical protein